MKNAFYFPASNGFQLLGTSWRPEETSSNSTGVVFCHAFGEERQKTYRATYFFAELLANRDIPSLRFDYRGTGDSEGNLADASIDSMIADTMTAVQVARAELQVDNVILLGLRLGGAIALRASTELPIVNSCILWNPVLDGASYYRQLIRTEKITNLSISQNSRAYSESSIPDGMSVVEADLMTPAMVQQLVAIDLQREPCRISSTLVTGLSEDHRGNESIQGFMRLSGIPPAQRVCWLEQPREYWSTESMYEGYFPTPTFDKTLEWLNVPG